MVALIRAGGGGHLVQRKSIPHMAAFRFVFRDGLCERILKSHEQFETLVEFLRKFRSARNESLVASPSRSKNSTA
jgi:hypothetical protein